MPTARHGQYEKGERQQRHQLSVEKGQKRDQAQVHHAGGDQDAPGEEVGMRFTSGSARHHDRSDGR